MKKLISLLILFALVDAAHAETFFCKQFKVGCYTDKDREKAMQNCRNLANEVYREVLSEAFSDPTKWQFLGNTSAQDYAMMRKRSMMAICIQKSPELSD